jgi:hypothetical protein
VARIDELLAVDAEARRKALTTAARHVRRQETAKPVLEGVRGKIEAAQSVALPSGTVGKPCQYALARWNKLTRFLQYPETEGCGFSRSWKAAVACKSRSPTFHDSPRACRFPESGAFQTLLPLCGSPGIHKLKRPGDQREVILRRKT